MAAQRRQQRRFYLMLTGYLMRSAYSKATLSLDITCGTNRVEASVWKSGWRSRQGYQQCFSKRNVMPVTLTVISSWQQRVKRATCAVVQVPSKTTLPLAKIVRSWATNFKRNIHPIRNSHTFLWDIREGLVDYKKVLTSVASLLLNNARSYKWQRPVLMIWRIARVSVYSWIDGKGVNYYNVCWYRYISIGIWDSY